jgi:hypothetical protein
MLKNRLVPGTCALAKRCCSASNRGESKKMAFENLPWSTVGSSARDPVRSLLQPVETDQRAGGSLRYRCPITGSYVLVTDEPTLAWLARPQAKLRCADCGDLHLIGDEAVTIRSGAAA